MLNLLLKAAALHSGPICKDSAEFIKKISSYGLSQVEQSFEIKK